MAPRLQHDGNSEWRTGCLSSKYEEYSVTVNDQNNPAGFEPGRAIARLCANPALILKLPLKKTAKGTICALQNLGGKLSRKHRRRVTV